MSDLQKLMKKQKYDILYCIHKRTVLIFASNELMLEAGDVVVVAANCE